MKASYDAFYDYIKSHGDRAVICDKTQVVKHEYCKSEFRHKFTTSSNKMLECKSVFICTGVETPHFLKNVMDYPYLVDNNFRNGEMNREYRIEEYASSYMEIEESFKSSYSRMPCFVNFMKENPQKMETTTFGFPCHSWDSKNGSFIKLGSMDCKRFQSCE